MGRRAGGGWRAGAVTAFVGLAVAIGAAGCARPDPVDHQALPGQAVGLAAIGTTESSSSAPPSSTAVAVTVPELTNAGTIANLTSPAVTVPGSTTPAAAPGSTPPPAPASEPNAVPGPTPTPRPEPAPAPAPTAVVPPYTTVLGWTGEGQVAYLTFDDGPGPATGQILDILAAKGVPATFCVVGQKVAENTEMTRRIVAAGHTLCNHSWDHPTGFNTLTPDVLAGQIGRTQDAVIQATGHTPRYLRAPEGSFGDPAGSVHQAAQQARTLLLGWAVDSKDWTKPGAATIVANVLGAASPGAIILMHDAGGADRQQTLDALPGVIDGLRAAGYTLLPLPPDPAG
jgi:peptidoglycan/xylan/chitin deacetylase (PgdA/CDA1 family)